MPPLLLTGTEALSSERRVDYVVPYPYGSNIATDLNGALLPRLTVMSQMAIDAAVHVLERHPEAKIVIAGETPYGEDLPNTTDLMIRRAQEVSAVADNSLLPLPRAEGNNNTYLQTETIANFFSENGRANILLVPLSYHIRRVAQTIKPYRLTLSFVTAEAVLQAAGNANYNKYLPSVQSLEKSERKLRFLNKLDKEGKLLNWLTKTTGARLVDVVEDDQGELVLEQGYARGKLQQAQSLSELLITKRKRHS